MEGWGGSEVARCDAGRGRGTFSTHGPNVDNNLFYEIRNLVNGFRDRTVLKSP